ncbi:MAG: riboflavin kinase, partial [Bacillota bacterium]|nr:riboflavin kinase [Bacillota bacterium]
RVVEKNKRYNSITNVGFNPTFNQNGLNFETYIIDFNGDLYNKEIVVEFIQRIRDEIKFQKHEDLTNQIKLDIERVNNIFNCLRD